MNRLEELRIELELWNKVFFEQLDVRQILVDELQREKLQNFSPFPHYDPQREWKLFNEMKSLLQRLTDRELLAYSLLIEAHASQSKINKYPARSHKIHWLSPHCFQDSHEALLSLINPLLLMIGRPLAWEKMNCEGKGKLKEEFAEIFQSMLR